MKTNDSNITVNPAIDKSHSFTSTLKEDKNMTNLVYEKPFDDWLLSQKGIGLEDYCSLMLYIDNPTPIINGNTKVVDNFSEKLVPITEEERKDFLTREAENSYSGNYGELYRGGYSFKCVHFFAKKGLSISPLTNVDRQFLSQMLDEFGRLRNTSSEEEVLAFNDWLIAHPSFQGWVPKVVTKENYDTYGNSNTRIRVDHRTNYPKLVEQLSLEGLLWSVVEKIKEKNLFNFYVPSELSIAQVIKTYIKPRNLPFDSAKLNDHEVEKRMSYGINPNIIAMGLMPYRLYLFESKIGRQHLFDLYHNTNVLDPRQDKPQAFNDANALSEDEAWNQKHYGEPHESGQLFTINALFDKTSVFRRSKFLYLKKTCDQNEYLPQFPRSIGGKYDLLQAENWYLKADKAINIKKYA